MIHQYRIIRFLLILFTVICSIQSFAGVEPYQNQLKGTIKKGDSLIVKDEKFRNALFDWNEITNRTVKNFVSLQLTYDTPVVLKKAFTCELDLKVEYYSTPDQAEPVTINSVKLKINFSPDSGATYKAKDVYTFDNGYLVKITVNNISSPELGDSIPPVLQLTNQVVIDRQYVYHPEKSVDFSGSISGGTTSQTLTSGARMMALSVAGTSTSNFLHLTWPAIVGAEEYDIEWAVFDEKTEKQPILDQVLAGQTVAPDVLDALFRNNATRITTSEQNFDITMVYNAQYIMVRMRQVHYTNGYRDEDDWDYKIDGTSQYAIWPITWHEENLNWQYSATFAEEGKKKEVVSYFDGSLRSRQMVTINNSDQVAVVQEIVYDEFGRAAANILPAPTDDNTFHYYPNFNLNQNNASYDYTNIKGTIGVFCENTPDALNNASGAAKYYSENNPFLDQNNAHYRKYNKYIPHANGYPISVTQYVPDNTGRVRTQGGVGLVFQPGKANRHVTKYYYGKPEPFELDKMFGNDVGYASHYLKNMVVDPNGQISVSYVNASGKTIATALTGDAPDGMDALPSKPALPKSQTFTILRPSQFVFDATKLTLTANTTYLSSVAKAPATFNYDIQQLIYTYRGSTFQICSNCYYDLTIKVTNDCGEPVWSNTQPAPIGASTGDCSKTDPYPGTFSTTFEDIGEYHISFEFKLSNDVIDRYTETYIAQRQQNGDMRTEMDFILDYLNNTDFSGCFNECSTCEATLGSQANFTAALKNQLTANGVDQSARQSQLDGFISGLYNSLHAQCIALRASCMVSSCSKYEQQMLQDVSPGGQYALFSYDPFTPLEQDINVIYQHWRDAFPVQSPGSDLYESEAIYDENGNKTSPYDQSFTLEMLVKYWKDEWAPKFLQWHPEKCKLDFCNANSNYIMWDDQVQTFINKASDIANVPGSSGLQYSYTNSAWLLAADPFFKSGAPGAGYYSSMQDDLNYFSNRYMGVTYSGASIKGVSQVIDYMLYCADPTGSTNSGSDTWNNCTPVASCRVPDKEWDQYKDIYFQVKQKYYQLVRSNTTCANICPVGTPYSTPGACASINDFAIEKVTGDATCSSTEQRIRITYAKGAAYRPMTVSLYYPPEYASVSKPSSVQFTIGQSDQTFCIASNVQVSSIKVSDVTCTGSATDVCPGTATGSLTLQAGAQQLASNKFQEFNQSTGIATTYTIVSGRPDQPPADATYCPDGTISRKDFYNCFKVFMPNSTIPSQFFNVWVIGCAKDVCANATQYQVEYQLDTYKFYDNGNYYYVKLQSGEGATPECGYTLNYQQCVKFFVGNSTTPILFTNASVSTCNACPDGGIYYENVNPFPISTNPLTYNTPDGGTVEIYPNTNPYTYIPSQQCSNYTNEWHSCYRIVSKIEGKTFLNATVLRCAPYNPCDYASTFGMQGGSGSYYWYYGDGYWETMTIFPDSDPNNPPSNPWSYCSGDELSTDFYQCIKIDVNGQVTSYQNAWVISCFGYYNYNQALNLKTRPSFNTTDSRKELTASSDAKAFKDLDNNTIYLVKKAGKEDKLASQHNDLAMQKPESPKNFTAYNYHSEFSVHTGTNAFTKFNNVWVATYIAKQAEESGKTADSLNRKKVPLAPLCYAFGYNYWYSMEFTGETCTTPEGQLGNVCIIHTSSDQPLCAAQTATLGIFTIHGFDVWTQINAGYILGGHSTTTICIPAQYGTETSEFYACANVDGDCPPPCPDAYKYKKSRFPEFNYTFSTSSDDLLNMQNDNNEAIIAQIATNCEAQADKWMQQLDACMVLYPNQKDILRAKLIEVCENGGDIDHVYGASTVRPGNTTSTYSSFKQAIQSVLGLNAFTMICNPWLLDEPHPYDPKQQSVSKTLTNTNPDLCAKLAQLRAGYSGSDFYGYLVNKYGAAMNLTSEQLDALIKSCNNCRYILSEDIPLPVFMEPGATGCITAADYNAAKAALAADMGGNLDVNHANYPDVLANYLNDRWGFSMAYYRYQDFETLLQSNPSAILCNNPPYTEIPADPYACLKSLVDAAVVNGRRDYDQYLAEEKRLFRLNYVNTCSQALAHAQLTTQQQTYHYTLYYYDQAGNLIRTVPPEGVRLLSDAEIDLVEQYRKDNTVTDCSGVGMPASENKIATFNSVSSVLQSSTAKSLELWLNASDGSSTRQVRFITPDNKYMYQAAISNGKLFAEMYTLEPGTNGDISITLSNSAVGDVSAITLQPWSHLFIQGADFNGGQWDLYLDGRKLTLIPYASAPPYPFPWEIDAGFTLPAEDVSQLKQLRMYNRPATPDEIFANYSNPCQAPVDVLSVQPSPLIVWGRFNLPSACTNVAETRTINNRGALQINGMTLNSDAQVYSNVSNNFTVELWVNPTETHEIDPQTQTGVGGVYGQKFVIFPHWGGYASANTAGMGLSVGTNGVSVYEHADNYMPALLVWQGNMTGWHHISVVYNNGKPSLYIDGGLAATGLQSIKATVNPSYNFGMGGYGVMKGGIDEVRIWNFARTQADISSDFRYSISPATAGLIGYWPMSPEDGSDPYDIACSHLPVHLQSNFSYTTSASPVNDEVPVEYALQGVFPRHRLTTSHAYNTFNHVVQEKTPDRGLSYFWYDQLSRLIASQNEEQRSPHDNVNPNRYTYTVYEPTLGRITEVGEKSNGQALPAPGYLDQPTINAFLASGTNAQITQTVYDKVPAAASGVQTGLLQENLYKRLSCSFYKDLSNGPVLQATYYSYDIIGNLKTLWQQVDGLALKRTDYEYDLATNKLNFVRYQEGQNDQFFYAYNYDANHRLTEVYTGTQALVKPQFGSYLLNGQLDAFYQYYLHGALARTELGQNKVQGMDYAYTLQGWLKGINGHQLNMNEMGNDGYTGNTTIAKDVLAYTLGYYQGDYQPIGGTSANAFSMQYTPQSGDVTGNNLFNGNISHTTIALNKFRNSDPVGYTYHYDQLNRLKEMRYHPLSSSITNWDNSTKTPDDAYRESITYDENGNILTYLRNGANISNMPLAMDNFTYNYSKSIDPVNNKEYLLNNQLKQVQDAVNDSYYSESLNQVDDLDNQPDGNNYKYDKIGNLVSNSKDNISNIEWTIFGKIKRITKTDGTVIEYGYDANGNRIRKNITTGTQSPTVTWYIKDGNGSTLGVYSNKYNNQDGVWWQEQQIYGSHRIGMWLPSINISNSDGSSVWGVLGKKNYELSNHLSNVLAVISDKKVGSNFSEADVVSENDYYPFGMLMPGRIYNATNYRYGFNGKEKDNEVTGTGNTIDFGERIYDSRIGRWLSVDPLQNKFPDISPYVYAMDNPLFFVDPEGAGADPTKDKFYNNVAKPLLNVLTAKGISRDKAFFIIAQVRQEQGWTPKYAKYNIYFNIKGTGTAGSLTFTTHEFTDKGEKIVTKAGFRMYNTIGESTDDYLSLLKRLYPGAYNALFDAKSTVKEFALAMQDGVGGRQYATDPAYSDHIENVYNVVTKDYGKYVKDDEKPQQTNIFGLANPFTDLDQYGDKTGNKIRRLEQKMRFYLFQEQDAQKGNYNHVAKYYRMEALKLYLEIQKLEKQRQEEQKQTEKPGYWVAPRR